MCNAYNNRHRHEAILDIARAMQLDIPYLPEFSPRHRIGIKNRGLILRPTSDGPLTWSWARWSIILPGAKELPAYPLNNARSDNLNSWPWKALQRRRCLIPVSPASGSQRSPPGRPEPLPGLLQHAG